MKTPARLKNNFISYFLVLLLICAIYVLNDQKNLSYPIKIAFIFLMALRFVVYRSKFTKYSYWSFAFLAVCGASALWAANQDVALYNFAWTLQVLLITILMEPIIDDKRKLEFVIKCFVIGGMLLTARLIIETPIDVWGTRRIGTAIGYNANDVGLKLSFAALSAAYFVNKGNKKLLYVLIMIVLAVVSLLSGSRKAFLVIMLGTVLFFTVSVKKSRRIITLIPIAIFFVIGFYYAIINIEFLYTVIGHRVEATILVFQGDTSVVSETEVRMLMIRTAFDVFMDKPILGSGIGNFAVVSGFDSYSHNNYVELLADLGVVGFLLYYSLYAYLLTNLIKRLLRGSKALAYPFTIVILAIIIETGLVSYNTGYLQIMIMLSFSFLRISNKSESDDQKCS